MNSNNQVPLERHFSPVPRSNYDSDKQQNFDVFGYQNNKSWSEIDRRYRTVILAEAGAGKTYEMSARAKIIEDEGRPAFSIRIENIVGKFEQVFEVGSAEGFEQWLSSQNEAWFFLDSVDEARLSNPRDFEKAICRFSVAIKPAQLRAHICISSRPYTWRQKSDRELIERYLPFKKPQAETTDRDSEPDERSESSESELEIFRLDPLDEDDIRLFAEHRSIPEIDHLINELERSNVMTLAERPFDLEGILDKWKTDRDLGGRSELLEHNIELRLNESEPDNIIRRPLESGKALEGARMLAAAVILCDEPGIQVSDNTHERTGIQANAILSNWNPRDIQTLLERAIFNDVIYGTVRFRHREVREYLAAGWLAKLLQKGNARHAIESLIFREQYGEKIVSPRLRPILPWLILKDENIRSRVLAIHPEIAVEGGDPAYLPLPERRKILNDILANIVQENKRSTAQDNSAIVRIAKSDLAGDAFNLIERYSEHDDAVFFLGRLVWQGKMRECVAPLLAVAVDPGRAIYARIAGTRAIMTCGKADQKSTLWSTILSARAEIPRKLLAELLQNAAPEVDSVALLLASIDKLPPHERFKMDWLQQALHGYIDRLPVSNSDATRPLVDLVCGLEAFLSRPPHSERLSFCMSEEFIWLMDPAVHAVERLVSVRADAAMQESALSILLNSPAVRESYGEDYDDYTDKLRESVPAWPELNDTLFWRRVKVKRASLVRDGNRLNNFFYVIWPDHYWSFGPDSFPRVLDWLKTRELEDDRLVALTLAFRIFSDAGQPVEWFDQLHTAVKGDTSLVAQLELLLNPTMSKQERKWQRQELQRKEKHKRKRLEEEQYRLEWIDYLKSNPDLILNPPELIPGEVSNDQIWLMSEIEDSTLRTKRCQAANWELLVDEFGKDVAYAYRNAATSHWRSYLPELPSEGANTSSIPHSLSFAIAGLEIEAREHNEFPAHLSKPEIQRTLRYITWEINGFPSWLETMYRANPQATMGAIQTEMDWELDNTKPNQTSNRLLHDLTYYAPWLHRALIEPLQSWLRENDLECNVTLSYVLHILKSGRMAPAELGTLAQTKVATTRFHELLPYWHAMWVDAQPDTGIPALSKWLTQLDARQGSRAAQVFVTALMGNRHDAATGPIIGNFQTVENLKTLYVLMHTYIRVEEDISRIGKGVYSPELRDHAQDARGRLFNLLSEIPGKATYVTLTKLAEVHPHPNRQSWMRELAYRRAEEDGDLEPWTAGQVCEFSSELTKSPATQRQLFELMHHRLIDLKGWLEHGDTSPSATWQKAETEPEMRNLVAGCLCRNADSSFSVSQEPEVANSQRMDIWLQNPSVRHPVIIEIKLLDKKWTGPKLCERLQNQLVKDYLRDGTGRCGVFLLIRQKSNPKNNKQWKIDGKLVGILELQEALEKFWCTISNCFPNVADIKVTVIDLSLRTVKSD